MLDLPPFHLALHMNLDDFGGQDVLVEDVGESFYRSEGLVEVGAVGEVRFA